LTGCGCRATYQAGCRCAACTAANTAYSQAWRADRRSGRVRLGAIISPREARRHLVALKQEAISARAVSSALGLTPRSLQIHTTGITLRRTLTLRLLRRRLLKAD